MSMTTRVLLNVVLSLLLLLAMVHVEPSLGGRVLNTKLSLQSLDKGPVTPSGPSGCTYIPGSGGTPCPVEEMNVAGNRLVVVPFGVATDQHSWSSLSLSLISWTWKSSWDMFSLYPQYLRVPGPCSWTNLKAERAHFF